MAHAISKEDLLHGVVAEFSTEATLLKAANKVREAGFSHMDAYTPFPVHGLDDAIGFRCTKVQWTIGIAGFIGFATGMGLQMWVNLIDYNMNVGGRPALSWPSFFPVAYECTILFAGLSAAISMIMFNGLPRPNHPIFNAPNIERATQDKFFLCVEKTDPNFDATGVKSMLESCGADNVAEVYGDEPEEGSH
jgi:hypothetical protein